jgi:hypothetical protein
MKKNSIVDEVIFDSIIYVLLHASKMQLLWSPMRASDVLPYVPTFNYLR